MQITRNKEYHPSFMDIFPFTFLKNFKKEKKLRKRNILTMRYY